MLAAVKSFGLNGIHGYPVTIEVDAQRTVPSFDIVGLPDSAIRESRNRVRAAIKNSSYDFPPRRIIVNLAPADTKKEGSLYDLPIALGFLAATEQIDAESIKDYTIIGELSLDGGLRRVNGVLPIILGAYQQGYRKFVIPADNAREAAFIEGVEVYAVKTLSEVTSFLGGILKIQPVKRENFKAVAAVTRYGIDISDVKGQALAKRAVEIAVAGGHNLLMCGAPGAGKTMLAKCVPSIMPDMTFEEALETTKIHSVAGILNSEDGMVTVRPFRTPHHTASLFSLTGGGAKSTPGEVSLAHNGVLFLDEIAEYGKKTLETLRQPLEDGVITVARVQRTVEYPARFMLIASMNPCPCGNYGSRTGKKCTCTVEQRRHYNARISGPLLDRIDLYVTVSDIDYGELRSAEVSETSAEVKKRVTAARKIQLERFSKEGIFTNAEMNNQMIKKYCALDAQCEKALEKAFQRFRLSARGATRVIKSARTIADLNGNKDITVGDLAEAIQYRARSDEE